MPGQFSYTATFDAADDGLVPGASAWFAVRARDDHGLVSLVGTNRYRTITAEWWVEGRVYDDSLRTALSSVIVQSLEPVRNGNTDGTGYFRLGPYRSIDTVRVETTSSGYYDFRSAELAYGRDGPQDIVLIKEYGLDPRCTIHAGDYLAYLRRMSATAAVPEEPLESLLWKWDHYPLAVFLPDTVIAATGYALADSCRMVLDVWNDQMGEEYFYEVGTRAEADVYFEWMPLGFMGANVGLTSLSEPAGVPLGSVAPQRIRVRVIADLVSSRFIQEIALHELGHVLGLINHAACYVQEYLLIDGGASGSLGREFPIHPDEMRAVRSVQLPAPGRGHVRLRPGLTARFQ